MPVSGISDPRSGAKKIVNEGKETNGQDGNENISAENLNAPLDDDDQLAPIDPIAGEGGSDEDTTDDIDPDSLPDPEPIPNVFMPNAGNAIEKKPRSLIKTVIIALIAFLIILLASLVFARGFERRALQRHPITTDATALRVAQRKNSDSQFTF